MKTMYVSSGAAAVLLTVLAWAGWNALSARSEENATARAELRSLHVELDLLRRGQEAIEKRLATLETSVGRISTRPREPQPAVAERGQAARGPAAGGSDSADSTSAAEAAAQERKLEECLARLADPKASYSEREKTWARLAKGGLLDAAVRHFEQRAKDDPQAPDAHFDLGQAYLQKILASGEIEKGTWATKADRAFDAALALDDHHWGARFMKAASFAYWPPIFGKQPEAVKQFEILRAQQEAQAPRPDFAQTYIFLGNLYAGQGNAAKASETWKKGAEIFPESSELAAKAAAEEPR
jgi:tetratricopeptide (TPR) repeat protein